MLQKSADLIMHDIDLKKRQAVIAHATYKTLDTDGDRANHGMFNKSWKENRKIIRFFKNHNPVLAPGKIINLWDDYDHAYTQVEFTNSTLGNDTLEELDHGTLPAASYSGIAVKQKKIPHKGYDILEMRHLETSVLSHWGAHGDSGVVAINKSIGGNNIELTNTIARMEKFIRNSKASDESIKSMQKEITQLKQLLIKQTDTANTDPSLIECSSCHIMSLGVEDDAGCIKCAECDHILIKGNSQPNASSNKDELRKLALRLKAKMVFSD